MQTELASDERDSWLLLWRVPGIGAATFHKLLYFFRTPSAVLSASMPALLACGIPGDLARAIKTVDRKSIAADVRWLSGPHRTLLRYPDPDYPPRLREIARAPPLLFIEGDPSLLGRAQIAIVGSRKASRYGAEFAYELARALAERGLMVTSGLAHGIDVQAHRGCLAGGGATVAVMGTGPDQIYPKSHRRVAGEIAENGALVTEFECGSSLQPENFPRRNRIISGLALGVVVVEAAEASGSLITARYALEQGREVFAVPGSVLNPLARGCHTLIKQGAKLVETIGDIIEELPVAVLDDLTPRTEAVVASAKNEFEPNAEQTLTLSAMGYDPVSIDVLVAHTGLTPPRVSSILLTLELNGVVVPHPGGLFVRTRPEAD